MSEPTLRDLNGGQAQLSGSARVQNMPSTLTPVRSLNEQMAEALKNLRLADTAFYKKAPVEITLGADTYARFIHMGVLPMTAGPLAAQNTTLGWMISDVTN